MKINWSFIEPVWDQAARLRGDFTAQSEVAKLAAQQARIERLRAELAAEKEQGWKAHAANLSLEEDNDALREENARLREAVKAAYFEGWYRTPAHNPERDWEASKACAALKETGE